MLCSKLRMRTQRNHIGKIMVGFIVSILQIHSFCGKSVDYDRFEVVKRKKTTKQNNWLKDVQLEPSCALLAYSFEFPKPTITKNY